MKKHFLISVIMLLAAIVPMNAGRYYLIGDATSAGMVLNDAIEMDSISETAAEWTGTLTDGELKILVSKSAIVPSYGPMVNKAELAVGKIELSYRATAEDPDSVFTVKAGRYTLRLDMSGEKPALEAASYPEVIYAAGSATDAGWDKEKMIEIKESAFNSGIYKTELKLQSKGEIKFLLQKDWGAGYGATEAGMPVNGEGEYDLAALGGDDKKFAVNIADTALFELEVDLAAGKMKLTAKDITYPAHLYIIGEAVGGWDWAKDGKEMLSEEDGVFSWTGMMQEGELKFTVGKSFDTTAYVSAVAGVRTESGKEYMLEKMQEDNKFNFPAGKASITVNLKHMQMAFTSLPSADSVYLFGTATSAGWDLGKVVLMDSIGKDIWGWNGNLNDGEMKFLTSNTNYIASFGPQVNKAELEEGESELAYRTRMEDSDGLFTVKAGRYSFRLDLSGEKAVLTVVHVPYPEVIYAIGSATDAGWDKDKMIEIKESAFNSGIYKTELKLQSKGEIKFLLQKDWGAGYGATEAGMPVNGEGEYDLAALGGDDKKFAVNIADAALFELEVDLAAGKMKLAAKDITYPAHLYIIGEAVGGWDWAKDGKEMHSEEEGIYTWSGMLSNGELKFTVDKSYDTTAYVSAVAGVRLESGKEYVLEKMQSDDNKFNATAAKANITVDLKQMKLSFEADKEHHLDRIEATDGMIRVYTVLGMLYKCVTADEWQHVNLPAGAYIIVNGQQTETRIVK